MKPEVGNLTWVSFEAIAKETPFSRDTIKHYLTAAELIGAMVKKYRTAREAHKKTKLFYPKYTDYTYVKTFMELLVPKLNETGKVRPKRLLYWTLNLNWVGYNWIDREYLPDWMLEVIRFFPLNFYARCGEVCGIFEPVFVDWWMLPERR